MPEGIGRPLWSVMIPTYNCAKYLRQTLESVLSQDPGAGQMQIEVVDDCSTKDDPEAVVRELGKGRVTFYRKPKNEGAIANFNTCIKRSCGHLLHILHGDDYVLSGFYSKIAALTDSHADVSGFFVRCEVVNEDGSHYYICDPVSHLLQPSRSPGSLLYRNSLRTPGVVIRRSFYEGSGGYLPCFAHVADWEMWIRVICQGNGLWVDEILASYRFFPSSDTGRLARTADNLRENLRLAEMFNSRFDDFDPSRFREVIVHLAMIQLRHFKSIGDREATAANFRLWFEISSWSDKYEVVLNKVRKIWP